MTNAQTLEAIKYTPGKLLILDQLLIPLQFVYEDMDTVEKAFDAIVEMKVRGAPAIAIVAVLAVAVEAHKMLKELTPQTTVEDVANHLINRLKYLKTSRPTAVNLFIESDDRIARINQFVSEHKSDPNAAEKLLRMYIESAEKIIELNINENVNIGTHGSNYIQQLLAPTNKEKFKVLTHCNTGALATSLYGTALGVIRFLHKDGKLEHAYATETRPYNQGARLTAFELSFEKIPSTLIVDSAVSYLFQSKGVDAVVVGADRVCANGDTANKIGTYQIAISAKYHNIPFFIAAPSTSIDVDLDSGSKIKIEERKAEEVTHSAQTKQRVVADGVNVWNPGFDVTPASLITGIITELGVIDNAYRRPDGSLDVKGYLEKAKK
jgi:methylthioribose-1-phosphate isomerase